MCIVHDTSAPIAINLRIAELIEEKKGKEQHMRQMNKEGKRGCRTEKKDERGKK
jgi:hypothetical protein